MTIIIDLFWVTNPNHAPFFEIASIYLFCLRGSPTDHVCPIRLPLKLAVAGWIKVIYLFKWEPTCRLAEPIRIFLELRIGNWDTETLSWIRVDGRPSYRHTSFYGASFYCASQMLQVLGVFYKLKARPSTSTIMTRIYLWGMPVLFPSSTSPIPPHLKHLKLKLYARKGWRWRHILESTTYSSGFYSVFLSVIHRSDFFRSDNPSLLRRNLDISFIYEEPKGNSKRFETLLLYFISSKMPLILRLSLFYRPQGKDKNCQLNYDTFLTYY